MSTPDPFTTLGLEPAIHIDLDLLESRYLELSRESHPDRTATGSSGDAAAEATALARSAAINDAYRALRDRWRRAATLIMRLDAGALEMQKTLDPMFLAEAMEVAEAVAEADDATRAKLRPELEERVEQFFAELATAIEQEDAATAARLFHQSKYYRKALIDLREGSAA